MAKNRIGVLTGGGDCPGLNAVLRAIVKTAIINYSYEVIGFKDGYRGLVYNNFTKLGLSDVSGLLDRGGTILGTINNFDPFKVPVDHDGENQFKDMSERVKDNLKMHEIECLIVIGGINTISIAYKLIEKGINIIVIPKTIENDVPCNDMTFGFMTGINTATQALDKLHSTAESHHRVMILEVMGRRSGWVALESGIAGGADIILIPEIPYDINLIARRILQRKNSGKGFSIISVAEGCKPKTKNAATDNPLLTHKRSKFDGVGNMLAAELEKLTGFEVKVTVLGYLQRGGEPSPYDRILTTRLGVSAVNMVINKEYNKMAGIQNNELCLTDVAAVAGKVKYVPVDGELVKAARCMGVSFGDESLPS